MMRERLPNRRRGRTCEILVRDLTITATVGFDMQGRPREVFMRTGKPGSALDALLADAAVMISIGLQHGVTAGEFRRSMARLPDAKDAFRRGVRPASAIGAVLDMLADFEREAA